MTWAWFLLVVVTLLAWWIAESDQKMADTTTAIFLTACVKIWIIGYQFMELKIAPAFLRYGFLLWLIAISCILVFLIT